MQDRNLPAQLRADRPSGTGDQNAFARDQMPDGPGLDPGPTGFRSSRSSTERLRI